MNDGDETRIYCCESISVTDVANNAEVLCAGIDVNPALQAQGKDASAIAQELMSVCVQQGGNAPIPESIKRDLASVARILNIAWLHRGIEKEARVICPRRGACRLDWRLIRWQIWHAKRVEKYKCEPVRS